MSRRRVCQGGSRVGTANWRARSCVLVASLVGTLPAAGQSYLGIEAGPTSATWAGSFVDASRIWGVHIATVLEYHVGARWSVAVAGVWQQKGASGVQTAGGLGPVDFKSSQLALPIVVRRAISVANGWALSPYGGVTFAITTDCQAKDASVFEFEEDCDVAFPRTAAPEVELDVPVGLRLTRTYIGGSRFVASLQYDIGMTNQLPDLVPADRVVRSRTWIVTSGIALPLFW